MLVYNNSILQSSAAQKISRVRKRLSTLIFMRFRFTLKVIDTADTPALTANVLHTFSWQAGVKSAEKKQRWLKRKMCAEDAATRRNKCKNKLCDEIYAFYTTNTACFLACSHYLRLSCIC